MNAAGGVVVTAPFRSPAHTVCATILPRARARIRIRLLSDPAGTTTGDRPAPARSGHTNHEATVTPGERRSAAGAPQSSQLLLV